MTRDCEGRAIVRVTSEMQWEKTGLLLKRGRYEFGE
jgi:hypothetical protein